MALTRLNTNSIGASSVDLTSKVTGTLPVANGGNATFVYLDSPNTTSSTTYTYYHKVSGGTGYLSINDYLSSMTLIEIGA